MGKAVQHTMPQFPCLWNGHDGPAKCFEMDKELVDKSESTALAGLGGVGGVQQPQQGSPPDPQPREWTAAPCEDPRPG